MTVVLRYLGFSGFEITTADTFRVVIDPFLAGSSSYGIPPSPVQLASLDHTDLVIVTHGAFDHLGQALEIVRRSQASLACGPDVRLHALEQGIPDNRILYLLSGCALNLQAVTIKALDVRHVSLFQSGDQWLSGQPLSYMIKLTGGPVIYHSGDTSIFGDLKLYGDLHRPDVALICVGGVKMNGHEVTPMPPEEAALALDWLGARLAIPMHYLPESDAPERFKALVTRRSNAHVHVMNAGDQIDLGAILEQVGQSP